MYTRWLPNHEFFIKNNPNLSDAEIKTKLESMFKFFVTVDAVKKKRQRLSVVKRRGRLARSKEETDEPK